MNDASATSPTNRYAEYDARVAERHATEIERERFGSDVVTRLLTLAVTIAAESHTWHWGDGDGGGLHNQLDRIAAELGLRRVATPRNSDRRQRRGIVSLLVERDGWHCAYCTAPLHGHLDSLPSPQIDHIVPRSQGGGNELANLALACGPCNNAKGAQTPEEWMGST